MIQSKESYITYIKQCVPTEDLYNCLAEEAAELACAASKMVRILRGVNPCSKNIHEVYRNLIEEYTDVSLIAKDMLGFYVDENRRSEKLYLWQMRLKEYRIRTGECGLDDLDRARDITDDERKERERQLQLSMPNIKRRNVHD